MNTRILVSLLHENGRARQTCLYPSLTTIPESCSAPRCWCQMDLSSTLVVLFFTTCSLCVLLPLIANFLSNCHNCCSCTIAQQSAAPYYIHKGVRNPLLNCVWQTSGCGDHVYSLSKTMKRCVKSKKKAV